MDILIASIAAVVIGLIVGIVCGRKYNKNTALIVWGAVTMLLFSWSLMILIGYIAATIVNEGLIIASFLMIGTPVIAVIGLVMILSGIVRRRT